MASPRSSLYGDQQAIDPSDSSSWAIHHQDVPSFWGPRHKAQARGAEDGGWGQHFQLSPCRSLVGSGVVGIRVEQFRVRLHRAHAG
jgi:hypothetical protein